MTSRGAWDFHLKELVRRAACDLPDDILLAIRRLRRREAVGSRGRWVLDTILENAQVARESGRPLCQDTGTPIFLFSIPPGMDERPLLAAARRAVASATRAGYLRRNTICTLTGHEIPDNLGDGTPVFHVERNTRNRVEVRLLLKGGGSENVSTQYSLPDTTLGAQRDWAGVRACILDTVVRAQGMGCAPGILGVCVGGDRATGFFHAKRQLFRPLNDVSPIPLIARLERRVLRETEQLGIGPMGFGGRGAVMAVKIGLLDRLPASFFVSVAYMCWACRRQGIRASPDGTGVRWL